MTYSDQVYYAEDQVEHRRARKASHAKSVEKRRQWLLDYKAERGCRRCGERNPIVLEMHHTDPTEKIVPISDWWRIGFDMLKEELPKCDVLCANCHRIVEHEKKLVQQLERRRGRASDE